jgi:hypothetical protein
MAILVGLGLRPLDALGYRSPIIVGWDLPSSCAACVPNSNFPTYAVGSVNETARRKVIIYSNNNMGILREGIFYHTLDLVGMCDLCGAFGACSAAGWRLC